MEFLRRDLRRDQHDQRCQKQQASHQITPVECHGDGVAAGLAEGGGGDLDDPEDKRDFRNLALGMLLADVTHVGISGFLTKGNV
jgi:hypothetical protein